MNKENIEPYKFTSNQSREEAVKNGHLGGIASGKARAEKKRMRECAEFFADKGITMPLPAGGTEDMTYIAAVVFRQYQKAIQEGDTPAAKFLQNLLGEEQIASIQQTVYNVNADTAAKMQALEHTDI